jgi:hypothetical protein
LRARVAVNLHSDENPAGWNVESGTDCTLDLLADFQLSRRRRIEVFCNDPGIELLLVRLQAIYGEERIFSGYPHPASLQGNGG